MTRISFVNGAFLPHEKAVIPIEDRGFQFADAVYEVVAYFNRTLFDFEPHFKRLEHSLAGLSIQNPLTPKNLRGMFDGLIEKNQYSEGIVYLQVTRGTAPRDHSFPDPPPIPNVVATARALDMAAIRTRLEKGVGIFMAPENRWRQVDIKSTSLLGNVLAKEAARKAGCYEAVFVDAKGFITEGTSSNIWMVDQNGVLKTRKTSAAILAGITRESVLRGLDGKGIRFEETAFTPEETLQAREMIITSTTSLVMPAVKIDGNPVGDGHPGPVTRALQENYFREIEKGTGYRVLG